MCLASLYDFTPDQREAIAKVESMRAMRDATAEWRAHYRSMPVAAALLPAHDPCMRNEAAAAGSFQEKAA
jgi:hypothetical protein